LQQPIPPFRIQIVIIRTTILLIVTGSSIFADVTMPAFVVYLQAFPLLVRAKYYTLHPGEKAIA
jgi:hypothetical protein